MNFHVAALVGSTLLFCPEAAAVAQTPSRFALLVAVRTYQHPDLNRPPLQYPEVDAAGLAEELKRAGYEVMLLTGTKATKKAVDEALAGLAKKGAGGGSLLVAVFGHGVEYERPAADHSLRPVSYFCPYDAAMRRCRAADGALLFGPNGEATLEPDPASLVSLPEVFASLRISNSMHRIVIADCCRNDPTAARGTALGTFGSGISPADLPDGTAALFACSRGQKAFEDPGSGHGALTRCLLETLCELRGRRVTVAAVGERMEREVPKLVSSLSRGRAEQTPWYITVKTVELVPESASPHEPPPAPPFPFDAGAAAEFQRNWCREKGLEVSVTGENGTDLVLIPPGEFLMGNEADAATLTIRYPYAIQSRFEDAAPRRRVRITQPFYLGRCEVTKGQFARFVDATGYRTEAEFDGLGGFGWNASERRMEGRETSYNWRNVGFPQSDDDPVVNVTWNDAAAYIDWLNASGRGRYRLPTEAEWEWAARSGGSAAYGVVDDPERLASLANVADAAFAKAGGDALPRLRKLGSDDGSAFTSKVGRQSANGFGVYDAVGNVAEWCGDWYDSGAYAAGHAVDPNGPPSGEERVFRGGSWFSDAAAARLAFRNRSEPSTRLATLGFRLARTP